MNKKINFSIIIFVCLFTINAYNQTDSIKISYSQESKDSSDFKYRRVYQYLDINMKNEKRLFKVSPGFNMSSDFSSLSLNVGYEWKIKKQYSLSVNTYSLFRRIKEDSYPSHRFDNYSALGFDFRYYFTLKKRMEDGISGNNLSGLYVGLGDDVVSVHRLHNTAYSVEGAWHDYRLWFDEFAPKLTIGLQRRLNNWSYFDVYSVASLVEKKIYINLGCRLGFAWGKK